VNEGPLYTFVVIWMLINVVLFVTTFNFYLGDKYTWLRVIVKDGLPVARGAASVLNFNCAVILIPVCRNLINAMRGCFESVRSVRRLFDKNILFHKWCAYVICLFATIHIGAHMFNVNRLATTDNPKADIMVDDNDTAETIAFTSVPGITGLFITLALILMVTTAVEQIRRSYFELFWYTHHLFIVFYVALCLHGSAGFVHRQINFDQHPYYDDEDYLSEYPTGSCITVGEAGCQTTGCSTFQCVKQAFQSTASGTGPVDGGFISDNGGYFCFTRYPTTFNSRCCPCFGDAVGYVDADIVAGGPATWTWVIGPLLLYLGERFYRFYMSQRRKLQVLKIVKHNDKVPVMEVQITKVKTQAGQYAFLHCPDVSMLEWHPFTLTSCPQQAYISFHIRLVGDWTCAFADRCGFYEEDEGKQLTVAELPLVAIDGPFGTSSEDIYRYDVGVCVCAGIGVTPFASLLQELYLRKFAKNPEPMRVKTIYFYWICPGFDSWGWFSNLLIEFEHRCIEMGVRDFLNIRIHMSRGWSKEDAEKIIMQDTEQGDLIVQDNRGRGLQAKLQFGRPNWKMEFDNLTQAHSGAEVGVFFCGPKVLSSELHRRCNEFTNTKTHGTKFFFNKENF